MALTLPSATTTRIVAPAPLLPFLSPTSKAFARTTIHIAASANRLNCTSRPLTPLSASILPVIVPDTNTDVTHNQHSYLFRTDLSAGLLKVTVSKIGPKYVVDIEASSLSLPTGTDLTLCWATFRSHPSTSHTSMSQPGTDFFSIPFAKGDIDGDAYVVSLEFDSSRAPFFLSFVLEVAAGSSIVKSHRSTNFCVPVGVSRGHPMPLGLSLSGDGSANFSIFSRNAENVVLCLYSGTTEEPSLELSLDPYVNRTGDIWHISVPDCQNYSNYGYRCTGDILWDSGSRFHMRHVLLDPYSKILGKFTPDQGDSSSPTKCLGMIRQEPFFDWEGDVQPQLPTQKLVVYRLNVGMFTEDSSSLLPENLAGTYTGIAEKKRHFENLGVNAILLEPISTFDEKKGPYFPYHFFSPMSKYGPDKDGLSAINSLKSMVKSLHREGIEVLLEVVFSHTAEGGDADCQTITFRGIDNSSYYTLHGDAGSGAHNVLNCSSPIVQKMIVDSLRYWVTEFHIDGFSFVNASALLRGPNGYHLSHPTLIESIAFDPLLSKVKIIADFWSPTNNSYNEVEFPHWKRWAEMNLRFCKDVRNFLRGECLLSGLATRLCGSGDVFSDSRGPSFSFNFITENFGLSLVDLVSFSDGKLSSEPSWNCGEEGATKNPVVIELWLRQIRNFLFILFMSLGVPVLNMGDECGLSSGSPSYEEQRPFNWALLETGFGTQIVQFIGFLSNLRKRRNDLLQAKNYLAVENIEWRGNDQFQPNWEDPSSKFLAMLLEVEEKEKLVDVGNLFVVFNANDFALCATLPPLPGGFVWVRLVDTSLPFPGFFANYEDPNIHQCAELASYESQGHSCALFEAKMISEPELEN